MEKKMEAEKEFCIKDADISASQSSTVSISDVKSQISNFSVGSEEPQWSSVDTAENSSLNLHSSVSLSTSETQESLNPLDESYSLRGSGLSSRSADSPQEKTYSLDATLESCNSENSLKLISFSETDISLKAEEICASPSEKISICKADFKNDSGNCTAGAGSPDLFKECVSDNTATKKRTYHQISQSSQEVSEPNPDSSCTKEVNEPNPDSSCTKEVNEPNPDSQHIEQDLPCKKFKPELQVGKESQNDDDGDGSCIQDSEADSFSDTQQKTSPSNSGQSLSKPTSMEGDSILEDTQKENTLFETEQTEMDEAEEKYHSYDFSQAPKFLTHCSEEFNQNNFLKGCKWAPDGSCILTNSDDRCLRLFNLPEQIYNSEINDISPLESVLKMQESGTIYDYCWYPGMSSSMPETCCLVSTSKDTPVHMWDAFTSELRCSYRAYDQVDEITSAHSLAFSLDGQKLYCGFNKMIRVFDVERPGRQFTERPTYTKKNGGQAGIISCITPSPVDSSLYATGSYSKEIALFWEPAGTMMCMFQGHQGGVTHICFSPDGNRIYSGGRKDAEILCWDLRNPGTILFSLLRQAKTNQRIYFDLDKSGRYMMSGNHDGTITVWDTTSTPVAVDNETDPLLYPCLTYPAHSDTTNGISIHPFLPIVASSCGQRHYEVFDDSGSEDETAKNMTYTNDLRLWWFT